MKTKPILWVNCFVHFYGERLGASLICRMDYCYNHFNLFFIFLFWVISYQVISLAFDSLFKKLVPVTKMIEPSKQQSTVNSQQVNKLQRARKKKETMGNAWFKMHGGITIITKQIFKPKKKLEDISLIIFQVKWLQNWKCLAFLFLFFLAFGFCLSF